MVARRQHAVNEFGRPIRSPEGEALTDLVTPVIGLAAMFTAAGEALAKPTGQTLARWLVLDMAADRPVTVAQVARARGYARQSVQRVADLLVRDGLMAFEENPDHRRAKLLRLTDTGREALARISVAQKAWSEAVGAEIGLADLEAARELLLRLEGALASHLPDGRRTRRSS